MATRAECTVDELLFPVLCLSRDTSIAVAETPEALQRCNARAFFKRRYFDGLMIFDSECRQYGVVSVEMAKPVTGLKKWLMRAFNRRLMVRLGLERHASASLPTVKEQVLAWLRKGPDFWEESREMAEWERVVRTAPDMRRLIRLFA